MASVTRKRGDYRIRAGMPALVMLPGNRNWRDWIIRHDLVFDHPHQRPPGHLIFKAQNCLLMIPDDFLQHANIAAQAAEHAATPVPNAMPTTGAA